jgi:hypothetical protein
MAAHDITDALKIPHPDVPLATIGYDIIKSLAQLAEIFKNKFQKPSAPEISQSPIKAAENKRPVALLQQVITSPVKHNYQTILQTQVNPTAPANVIESQKSPQLPRVDTLTVRSVAPPSVLERARNLSPKKLYPDDSLDMDSSNQDIH